VAIALTPNMQQVEHKYHSMLGMGMEDGQQNRHLAPCTLLTCPKLNI
jgi:hypothetical protein